MSNHSIAADVASPSGNGISIEQLAALRSEVFEDYPGTARRFYAYLPEEVRELFINDAIYHQPRYLEMLKRDYGSRVLELGSDKPFITHFLRTLHPNSSFETVSIDIPFSPYPITRIDIESQVFPFEDETFSDVIFTEVLEHLFRDPAWAIFQMNRVMANGGRLFLTTPNACGYDSLINLLHQGNPNARCQFYQAIESGHPHLWTLRECETLLSAHGFEVLAADTVDYVDIPLSDVLKSFLNDHASHPELHGQSLRIEARKTSAVGQVSYPLSLFPEGRPVQLMGALKEWAVQALQAAP